MEFVEDFAGGLIPAADVTVARCGDELLAGWTEIDGPDVRLVARECEEAVAGGDVPDADGSIKSTRGDYLLIGGPG